MKKTILFLLFIPFSLMAQKKQAVPPYSLANNRTVSTPAAGNNLTPVMQGTNVSGIKISRTDPHDFPRQEVLNIYPNPAVSDTRAVFSSDEYGMPYHLVLISMEGRQLLQRKGITVKGANIVHLNIGSYPTGTYFLQILIGERRETKQFIKVTR